MPLHFLVLTSDHRVLLHVPAWGDFLLHHTVVVAIPLRVVVHQTTAVYGLVLPRTSGISGDPIATLKPGIDQPIDRPNAIVPSITTL
jgi:hypothetical protein